MFPIPFLLFQVFLIQNGEIKPTAAAKDCSSTGEEFPISFHPFRNALFQIAVHQFAAFLWSAFGEEADEIQQSAVEYDFFRQFLTDERFLTKIREGRTADIRPCISCHSACLQIGCYKDSGALITHGGDSVCALYPRTKSEKKYTPRPAKKPRRIAIIGGGIAGMESALQLAARGHDVTLYEKSGILGGVFIAAAAPSFMEKDKELL
ncbi:MAG: FAD-dependent oxidoreductase, partial [Anaerotignum sp.]|nr:FAD-dependent oxidoreductase [Anaerotignum sp.]